VPGDEGGSKGGVPSFEALAGSCLRGPGHADASPRAIADVPPVFSIARPDVPRGHDDHAQIDQFGLFR
jgi:hypothetical protein